MENQSQRENAATENNVYNNFSNTTINTQNFHLGSGSNINQNPTNISATAEVKNDKFRKECDELKENLRKKAIKNCSIEQVKFGKCSDLGVNYVPLRMVRMDFVEDIKEDIRNAKKEIKEILTKPADEELKPETFFKISKEFAENSDRYKNVAANEDAIKEMKETCLNKLSNLVFVIGHAGIGKTCLTKKYQRLILNKKVDSDFPFYLKFRDVDYKRKINLLTFLTGDDEYEDYDKQTLKYLLNEISNSDNVTIVLDGFDEASLKIEENDNADPNLYKKAKAQDFILGLLNGNILSKSRKLVTSRPKQLFDLPNRYQPLFIVKLLGIDKTSQQQICKNICGDDFDSVFKQIQSNSGLSNYCCVPLICIIIVYCMYKNFKFERNFPNSLTEIFIILICMYLRDPTHIRGKLPFKNLCELAFNGISKQKLFFNEDDLKRFSLDKQDQNNFTMTFQCFDRTDKLEFISNATLQYTYFSHLIVQEWFAALYLMLYAKVEEFNEVLFSKNCKIDLRSTNFNVFVSFLFGLGNEQMFKKYYQHRYFPDKIDPEIYSEKLNLLKNYLTNINGVTNKDYEIISWLYELKDDEVARLVADKFDDDFLLSFVDLPQNIILPLNYVLRCTGKNLQVCVNYAFEPSLF